MSQPEPSPAVLSALAIVAGGNGILQTKYAYFAAHTIAIYDILISLDIEVEYIWKQKITLVTVLFFFTRYYYFFVSTVLQYVFIQLFESLTICERLSWIIPVFIGVPLTALPNFIITIRIYALYRRNIKLALALLLYITAQAAGSLAIDFRYPFTPSDNFGALVHPELVNAPALRICLPIFSNKLSGGAISLSQIMQSIFDTVALTLILIKARKGHSGGLITLIAKQGIAYYILNAATYTTWAFLLIYAPLQNKFVMAGISSGLACVSVNRLTLHLRSYAAHYDPNSANERPESEFVLASVHVRRLGWQRRDSWLGASTFEAPADGVPRDGDGLGGPGLGILEMRDMSSDGGLDHKLRS